MNEAAVAADSIALAKSRGQAGSAARGGKSVAAPPGMTAMVDRGLVTLAAPLHAPSAGGPTAFYSHLHDELARILTTCGGQAASVTESHLADVAVPSHEVRARLWDTLASTSSPLQRHS